MTKPLVRPSPCPFCPYRKDVPSGVWHKTEYEKLIDYDKPTGEQPTACFACHESTGQLCSGWAQCHNHELLSLRLEQFKHGEIPIPETTTPIFASGAEAAAHGMREIRKPSPRARRAVGYLHGKMQRKNTRQALTKKQANGKMQNGTTIKHRSNSSQAGKTARRGHPGEGRQARPSDSSHRD